MLFANLYNKVLGFFRQTENEEVESAKETACNRLRVVLMQDRTNLTPELMDRMRKELVELLSRYVEMDKEALDLSLEQDGDQVALMLSIPVIRAKDEEEIKAALEAEDKAKAEAIDADDDDEDLDDDGDTEENDDAESEDDEIPDEVLDTQDSNEVEESDEVEDSEDELEEK